jgi:hypothetical protein
VTARAAGSGNHNVNPTQRPRKSTATYRANNAQANTLAGALSGGVAGRNNGPRRPRLARTPADTRAS